MRTAPSLLALVLTVSCAHGGAGPAGQTPPTAAQDADAASAPARDATPTRAPARVSLSVPAPGADHLDVRLETGCPDGHPPALTIDENYAALRGLDRFVANVRAVVDGRPARVRRTALGRWEVEAERCRRLEVRHQILLGHREAWNDRHTAPGLNELPYVDDDHAFLFGRMLVLSPAPEPEGPVELALSAPDGWIPAGPWPMHDGVFLAPSFSSLRENYFGVGRFTIRTERLDGLKLTVALQPGAAPDADAGFADDLVRTIGTAHALFDRDGSRAYLVLVNRHDSRTGGSVRRDSIVLNVVASMPLAEEAETLQQLVAHEFFHTWRCAARQEDEAALAWLGEGFTEYFAWRILHEAGHLDEATWADRMQRLLERARDLSRRIGGASLADAAARFYEDPNRRAFVYPGGAMLAMHLDGRLQAMEGDRSLLGFMRRLLNDRCPNRETWGVEDVLALAGEYGGEDFAEEWRELIHTGRFTDAVRPGAGPGCRWAEQKVQRPRLGIGWMSRGGVASITEVSDGGAAARAGLRKGDRILSLGGVEIHGKRDFDRAIAALRRGEPLTAEIQRDGGRLSPEVTPVWVEAEETRLVCGE